MAIAVVASLTRQAQKQSWERGSMRTTGKRGRCSESHTGNAKRGSRTRDVGGTKYNSERSGPTGNGMVQRERKKRSWPLQARRSRGR